MWVLSFYDVTTALNLASSELLALFDFSNPRQEDDLTFEIYISGSFHNFKKSLCNTNP